MLLWARALTILAVITGFVWMILLALQTKAIAQETRTDRILVIVFFSAIVFAISTRIVALSGLTIFPYAVGCTLGAYVSTRIRVMTRAELEMAVSTGVGRRLESLYSAVHDQHGYVGNDTWTIDIESAASEMASCLP